jgi:hypothetical protein
MTEQSSTDIIDNKDAAIDRIICATGLPQVQVDREKLYQDLRGYWFRCHLGHIDLDPARRKRLRTKFDRAIKSARRLQEILLDKELSDTLGDPRCWVRLRDADCPNPIKYIQQLIPALSEIARGRTEVEYNKLTAVFIDRNLFDLFVGMALPNVFREHFKRDAAFSRSGGKVGGPFVRFADQVLFEFGLLKKNGKRYSPESIAKSLQQSRKATIRRRVRS